jgi:hypothetical protein
LTDVNTRPPDTNRPKTHETGTLHFPRLLAYPSPAVAPQNTKGHGDAILKPALLFDLDGTLADSVYQHVLAWREALEAEGIDISIWRIQSMMTRPISFSISMKSVAAGSNADLPPASRDR